MRHYISRARSSLDEDVVGEMWTALPTSCRRLNSPSGDLEWGHAQRQHNDNSTRNTVMPGAVRSRHAFAFHMDLHCVPSMCLAHVPFAIGRGILQL